MARLANGYRRTTTTTTGRIPRTCRPLRRSVVFAGLCDSMLFASLATAVACAGERPDRGPAATTPADSPPPPASMPPVDSTAVDSTAVDSTAVDSTTGVDSTVLAPDTSAGAAGGDVVASFRRRIPEDLLLRRGACPFECCIYRDWEATDEIPVVAEEQGTAPPVFTIGAGERFRADSGNVHVTSIAVVPVTDSVGDPPYWSFGPGDTLVVLDYIGEGFYNVWHDGAVVEVPTFWSDRLITAGDGSIGEHATEWWVHITMPDGRTGWIRADTAPQIAGADACG